jgi:hypothetical protein
MEPVLKQVAQDIADRGVVLGRKHSEAVGDSGIDLGDNPAPTFGCRGLRGSAHTTNIVPQ